MGDYFDLKQTDLNLLEDSEGRICIVVHPDRKLDQTARRLNRLTKGAIERLFLDDGFSSRKSGDIITLPFPAGMKAKSIDVLILERTANTKERRLAGAGLAKRIGTSHAIIFCGGLKRCEDLILGCLLRQYTFDKRTTKEKSSDFKKITFLHNKPESLDADLTALDAVISGVHFTRDLVNEPANILTTTEFAERLKDLQSLGLAVEVFEEDQMAALGMGALLCVGQGSESPSKMVVMRWNGGPDEEAPLALVGKGVVFDTGGISLKPASGMPEMIMDMGGAGVVAGTMKTLALRKAKANVVGLVGLVENMPSGSATRPGDIVTSMKGDTIEVLNTDAEGRLVLSDVMWYAQDRFSPAAMIDLATLTGAIIVALGSQNAGLFSNDDRFCNAISAAAFNEAEGVWRMPLSKDYDAQINSDVADMANMGKVGRSGGSIVAAQFLQRFVKENTPWAHLDIAGVTYSKKGGDYSPSGATGWGVMTLNRLVKDMMEAG